MLPTAPCWPPPSGRVEDGAGLCSSATPFPPTQSDVLGGLRKVWCKRLLDSGLHQQIASRLLSGSKTNPLSEAELAPFLADLRTFLHVESDSTWKSLVSVLDGQPFRLNLWHCLSLLCSDPDSDYFHVLREGVPLGVGSTIPVCPVMHPPAAPDAVRLPLEHCESAWKSALDNADLVESLLQDEVDAGWIREVPGGDAELRRLYQHTAVGKLGLVLAPGRPPRLVVDSSVSGVTSNTHLPNRSANPSLMDVRRSVPISDSLDQLVALVLDVAKAHRRMLIRPADRGLLCFRHAGRLYQSITLNFGARVSSFFWARCAGLLMRLLKRLLRVRHSSWIYVDDLLSLFDRLSAPLWASVVVVLLLCLKIPMSWHKGTLSPSVVWIGWQMDFECFTVRLDPSKLSRLVALANQLLSSRTCPVRDLERLASCSGCLPSSAVSGPPWLRFTRTSILSLLCSLPFLPRSGRHFAITSTLTSFFCGPSALQPFLSAPSYSVSARQRLPAVVTCAGLSRSRDVFGFNPPALQGPSANCPILPAKSSVCGLIWPHLALTCALSSCRRDWSALLSLTLVPMPLPWAWVVLSVCMMAVSCSFRRSLPNHTCSGCSSGFRPTALCSHTSLPGSLHLRPHSYSCCIACWAMATFRATLSSAPTIPLRNRRLGRAFQWPLAFAPSFGLSLPYRRASEFPFMWIISPASPTTLPMV